MNPSMRYGGGWGMRPGLQNRGGIWGMQPQQGEDPAPYAGVERPGGAALGDATPPAPTPGQGGQPMVPTPGDNPALMASIQQAQQQPAAQSQMPMQRPGGPWGMGGYGGGGGWGMRPPQQMGAGGMPQIDPRMMMMQRMRMQQRPQMGGPWGGGQVPRPQQPQQPQFGGGQTPGPQQLA